MLSNPKKLADSALDWLYPPRCPICDGIVEKKGAICPDCRGKLSYVKEPRCKKCGRPLLEDTREFCSICSNKAFHFREGMSVFVYDGAVRKSVLAFKFKNRPEYAFFYAEELHRQADAFIRSRRVEALVPVPVHPSRKRTRGYNQAELLAKQLGGIMDLPVMKDQLMRTKKTMPQKGLGSRERLQNLSDAFKWKTQIGTAARRILLVDDIFTTGSTIEACSRTILASGAKEIYFLCICTGKDYREE